MAREPQVFEYIPRGRKVERPDTPDDYVGSIGVLRRADRELVKLLRRNLREIAERDLEQDGKVWTDRKTDEQFRLFTAYVDPIAPQEADVTAFAVSDGNILYFKPLGTPERVESVFIGVHHGGWKAS
jgi:hypothetical protein